MSNPTETSGGAGDATRFEIRRRLGQGGMGIIHEAFDTQRGIPVALKTLRNTTPEALFRFKQEFRALADVRHPNLVTLYELLCIEDDWLFTMELIDGVNLLAHLRPGDQPVRGADRTETQETRDLAAAPSDGDDARQSPAGAADVARVREVFRQLALGVQALHRSGHLHRDIKPSNVMVTREGRVVLLDFGVVAAQEGASETIARRRVVGTPTYMSPEQMKADVRLTPANDWYAFGLVLYEALTGQRPFSGTFDAMLIAKLGNDFEPPRDIDPDLPDDLDQLCRELLRADPEARASEARVLACLGETPAAAAQSKSPATGLVGRAAELAVLDAAHARARAGKGGVVYVVGGSGMGKSSTVGAFLARIGDENTLVLAGRCHEHEAVPYKGVDRLVDELSRALALLPIEQASDVLPRDLLALTRLFPVLRRLDAVAEAPPRYGANPDPIELRRRGFAALRELLAKLAANAPTVLFIDDFQWTDPDSATLLAEIMSPPHVPPLLLIIGSRSEDSAMIDLLQSMLPATAPPWHERVELGPLDADAARTLIRTAAVGGAAADRIIEDSGGNPYFLQELARAASARGDSDRVLTLDEMLVERASALPVGARSLLELVSVAGKPTPHRVVRSALTRITDEPLGAALGPRAGQQLIRSRRVGEQDLFEPYHDRIRESVVAAMSEDRRRELHHALAAAMQALDSADVEALASHIEGAGQPRAAADGYARAAAAAADALAFDRAAALYRRSLELAPLTGVDGAKRVAALADALANAGRGAEAAEAYQRTVALLERAEPAHPLVLTSRARAAEELLRSGRVDEGLEALAAALGPVGLSLPKRDLLSLAWLRVRVRLRGTRFRPRPAHEIPAQDLLRVEVAASAAAALSNTAHLKGAVFQCVHLLHALRAGHVNHVARGVAFESIFESLRRKASRNRVKRLVDLAYELAERDADPLTVGLVRGSHGLSSYQFGEWETCADRCREAAALMREQCTGVWFVVNSIEMYELWALYYLGRLTEMSHKVSAILRAATSHGDRYLVATMSTGLPNQTWLMRNDLQGARHAARDAMHGWSRSGYHLQHNWMSYALANADLYAGDGAAALRRVDAGWRDLKRSMLLNIPMIHVEAYDLLARAALATAARSEQAARRQLLARAARAARALLKSSVTLAQSMAAMHRAGAAELTGRREEALDELRRAAELADQGKSRLHAAVIGARIGALEGDRDRRAAELDWMRGQGIVDPVRFASLLYPVGDTDDEQ